MARSWKKSGGDARETLEVSRNKRPDKALAEIGRAWRRRFFPLTSRTCFSLTGKKWILRLAGRGAGVGGTGVRNLLGMDSVERLQKDLRVLERRRQSAATPGPDLEKIRGKEKELEELRGRIQRLTEDKAELRTRKLDSAQRNLEKVGGGVSRPRRRRAGPPRKHSQSGCKGGGRIVRQQFAHGGVGGRTLAFGADCGFSARTR